MNTLKCLTWGVVVVGAGALGFSLHELGKQVPVDAAKVPAMSEEEAMLTAAQVMKNKCAD